MCFGPTLFCFLCGFTTSFLSPLSNKSWRCVMLKSMGIHILLVFSQTLGHCQMDVLFISCLCLCRVNKYFICTICNVMLHNSFYPYTGSRYECQYKYMICFVYKQNGINVNSKRFLVQQIFHNLARVGASLV